MPARIAWNRATVPTEVETGPQKVLFVRRRRFPFLLLGCGFAAVAWGCWKFSRVTEMGMVGTIFLPFWSILALLFLGEALRSVWSQKILVVDLERREIALVARRPWGLTRRVFPFSTLRGLTVENPADTDSRVSLWVEGQTSILLGRDFDGAATEFARRLSRLTGIPYPP